MGSGVWGGGGGDGGGGGGLAEFRGGGGAEFVNKVGGVCVAFDFGL